MHKTGRCTSFLSTLQLPILLSLFSAHIIPLGRFLGRVEAERLILSYVMTRHSFDLAKNTNLLRFTSRLKYKL